MRYDFLEKTFNVKSSSIMDLILIQRKEKTSKIHAAIAQIVIIIYYIIKFISISYTYQLDNVIWMCLGGLIVSISSLIILFLAINQKIWSIINGITFAIFYAVQIFTIVESFTLTGEFYYRILRNLYLLFIFGLIAITLMQFSLILSFIISLINLIFTLFIQIYTIYGMNKFYILIWEMLSSLLIPAFGLFMRWEYDKTEKLLYNHMQMRNKAMIYIDDLLDKNPSGFITLCNDQVVYLNSCMEKFLKNNFDNQDKQESGPFFNIEKDSKLLIIDKINFFQQSEHFLSRLHLNTLNLEILQHLNNENLLINQNLWTILFKIRENQNSNALLENHFFFLGVFEFKDTETNENLFFNVHIRPMTYLSNKWIELIISNITMLKKFKAMDEVFKMKEKLLAKIAHEFKTPLVCITALTDELSNKNMEYLSDKINDINSLSNYTLFLINDIISYLQPCNQSIKLNIQPVNINSILEFAFQILKTLINYSKDKSNYVIPILEKDCDIIINSDQLRIKQILLNLISNAVKFTKNGFIKMKSKI